MANVLTNLFNVATGSGLHEQAMRDYLTPFTGGKTHTITEGPVADYMSGYLKDYVDPTNKVGGTWKDGIMSVTGLGKGANPYTKYGLEQAANLSSNPSFQAENLFGEGTLKRTPSGYEYTGGKFDFNFEPGSLNSWIEKNIFQPSEYKMSFDKDFNPTDPYAGITGHTASLINPITKKMWDAFKIYRTTKNIKKHGPKILSTIGASTGKAKADANKRIQVEKERAATAPQRREGKGSTHMSRSRDQGGLGSSRSQARAVSDANRAAGMSGWRLADGGLINFYRYGGFV